MVLIAWIVTILGVLYILSPLDFIPDVIPVVGWTDDFLVLMIILATWAFTLFGALLSTFGSIIKIGLVVVGLWLLYKYINKPKKKQRER